MYTRVWDLEALAKQPPESAARLSPGSLLGSLPQGHLHRRSRTTSIPCGLRRIERRSHWAEA